MYHAHIFQKGVQTLNPNKMAYQLVSFHPRLPANCYAISPSQTLFLLKAIIQLKIFIALNCKKYKMGKMDDVLISIKGLYGPATFYTFL